MNCYKCKRTIDKIFINNTDDNALQSVLHHIESCESCKEYYNAMEQLINDLSSFEEHELPKGFHNRLHFALQREAESPKKSTLHFSSGLRAAAIGAFSLILIIAAVSILPRTKSANDAAPMMEMADTTVAEEAVMKAEMADEAQALDDAPASAENEFTAESRQDSKDSVNVAATEECNDFVCTYLSEGGTKVLVLDVEDVDEAYAHIMTYLPDAVLLPDTSWVIDDLEEPEEYVQIRTLMSIEQVEYLSEKIGLQYGRNIEIYSIRKLQYDDIDKELAELQEDLAYLYIVLY